MPVAGLVVTLADHDALRLSALSALLGDERVTVGAMQPGGRLPVVTEAATLDAQQQVWNAIAATPGVLSVDLAYLDFDDVQALASTDLPARRRRESE